MNTPEHILKSYWNYDSFRPLQREIIAAVLSKNDVIALLPTGGGKSLCFQIPALLQDGCCLVVSPLISLMEDQVKRLHKLSISAAFLSAGMHHLEVQRTLENASEGAYKLLYVSPERLQSRLFREYFPVLSVTLIAIDEAHCISQWGHDFRPDYLKIEALRSEFLCKAPILALTATATGVVIKEIAERLAMNQPEVFRQSFKRPNIFFSVRYSENKTGECKELVREVQGASIIYCRSRRQTEVVTRYLRDFHIPATHYHAGLPKEKRHEAQEKWMQDERGIMVATTAFGMGIDKINVRKVIHFDVPENPEAYYQEVGRAGRDGLPAEAVTLYNNKDITRLRESTNIHFPQLLFLKEVYQAVSDYLQVPTGTQPDRYFPFDLSEFCKRFHFTPLKASAALKTLERSGLWAMSDAAFHPATIQLLTNRTELDQLQTTAPDLAYLVTQLLRLYGGMFHYPTPISLAAVAQKSRLTQKEVHALLQRLHASRYIEYCFQKEGANLYFQHTRVESKHLLLDVSLLNKLRQNHADRTEYMINYLGIKKECRQQFILRYFGENEKNRCGHCDLCIGSFNRPKDLRKNLLRFLNQRPTLAQILDAYKKEEREFVLEHLRTLCDQRLVVRTTEGNFVPQSASNFNDQNHTT